MSRSIRIKREAFAQETRDTILVVMSDNRRGGRLDPVIGVGGCVAFIGRLEHAEVVVTVAEANDTLKTEQSLHRRDGATLARIAVVDIEPAPFFALLAKLAADNGLDQLSMGMSGDYPTAVMLGATHVRVGTALFGERA